MFKRCGEPRVKGEMILMDEAEKNKNKYDAKILCSRR